MTRSLVLLHTAGTFIKLGKKMFYSIGDILCIDYNATGFLVLISALHYKVTIKGYGEPT